ncbi:MAG: cell division protein ZapB [Nitrospira sp.]|nr:cell division protein ZapB [Nitrospira sp.]
MALDRLDALENRIKDLVKLVQDLKRRNAAADEEMKVLRQRLAERDDLNRRWEQERVDIKARIEKVLGDIELLECFEERKEVAIDEDH